MSSFNTILSSAEKQMGSKQDFITTGSTENFDYIVEADGHGSSAKGSECVDYLRSIDWSIILQMPNPVESLERMIASHVTLKYNYLSGSTLSIAKIYKDRIELTNIGDSQTAVFINGNLVYINESHDLLNESEKERISHLTHRSKIGIKLCTLSPTQICIKQIRLPVFDAPRTNGLALASTQSLGHCNITGLNPTYMTIPYESEQFVRVFAWSDGVSDMMNLKCDLDDLLIMTAAQLVDKYEQRWKQTWILCENENDLNSTKTAEFPDNNYDDVSLGMWSNY